MQKIYHRLSCPRKRFMVMPQISFVTDRRRKNIEGQFAMISDELIGNFFYLINIVARKGINKNRPRIVFVIFNLLF
jgi:hypothetical protein